jgi:hypothetical protein
VPESRLLSLLVVDVDISDAVVLVLVRKLRWWLAIASTNSDVIDGTGACKDTGNSVCS